MNGVRVGLGECVCVCVFEWLTFQWSSGLVCIEDIFNVRQIFELSFFDIYYYMFVLNMENIGTCPNSYKQRPFHKFQCFFTVIYISCLGKWVSLLDTRSTYPIFHTAYVKLLV